MQDERAHLRCATISSIEFYFRVVDRFGLVPFQGASIWVVGPRVETWVETLAEFCSPFGACPSGRANNPRNGLIAHLVRSFAVARHSAVFTEDSTAICRCISSICARSDNCPSVQRRTSFMSGPRWLGSTNFSITLLTDSVHMIVQG